jgi:hypothetical protein
MGNSSSNTAKQFMSGRIIRSVQGRSKRQFVGRAMTFKNQAAQTQQSGAVVTAMINSIFKGI